MLSLYIFLIISTIEYQPITFKSIDIPQSTIQTNQQNNIKNSIKIIFGSCAKQDIEPIIFNSISKKQPHIFIWLGDSIYLDNIKNDINFYKENIPKYFSKIKNSKSYQNFINPKIKNKNKKNKNKNIIIPKIIGTWDDHDSAGDNCTQDYELIKFTKKYFLDFLDEEKNSERYLRKRGVYTSHYYKINFTEGDYYYVSVLLLDVRSFSTNKGPYGEILGEEQWEWLENQLFQICKFQEGIDRVDDGICSEEKDIANEDGNLGLEDKNKVGFETVQKYISGQNSEFKNEKVQKKIKDVKDSGKYENNIKSENNDFGKEFSEVGKYKNEKKIYCSKSSENDVEYVEEAKKHFFTQSKFEKRSLVVIGSGIEILAGGKILPGFEFWAQFGKERRRLIKLLEKYKLNFLLISGDVHYGEITSLKGSALKYELVELTSSGLTHEHLPFVKYFLDRSTHRIEDKIYKSLNFGMIEIFKGENEKVKISVHDIDGGERINYFLDFERKENNLEEQKLFDKDFDMMENSWETKTAWYAQWFVKGLRALEQGDYKVCQRMKYFVPVILMGVLVIILVKRY